MGEAGVEIINQDFGPFFDNAIKIITAYGGDVIKFLGDAILVAFQTDDITEKNLERDYYDTELVQHVLECGLQLLKSLDSNKIDFEKFKAMTTPASPLTAVSSADNIQMHEDESSDSLGLSKESSQSGKSFGNNFRSRMSRLLKSSFGYLRPHYISSNLSGNEYVDYDETMLNSICNNNLKELSKDAENQNNAPTASNLTNLRVHIGMAYGSFTNIVIGGTFDSLPSSPLGEGEGPMLHSDPLPACTQNTRYDYSVTGELLVTVAKNLDKAKQGELALPKDVLDRCRWPVASGFCAIEKDDLVHIRSVQGPRKGSKSANHLPELSPVSELPAFVNHFPRKIFSPQALESIASHVSVGENVRFKDGVEVLSKCSQFRKVTVLFVDWAAQI